MLLYRVESESEPILVEQVVGESPVVAGFDIRGVDPETEIVNESKPRFMHYTITLFTLKSLSLMLLIALSCLIQMLPTCCIAYLVNRYHP